MEDEMFFNDATSLRSLTKCGYNLVDVCCILGRMTARLNNPATPYIEPLKSSLFLELAALYREL